MILYFSLKGWPPVRAKEEIPPKWKHGTGRGGDTPREEGGGLTHRHTDT